MLSIPIIIIITRLNSASPDCYQIEVVPSTNLCVLLLRQPLCSLQQYRSLSAAYNNIGRSMYLQRRFSTVLKTHWLGSSTSILTFCVISNAGFRNISDDLLRVSFRFSHLYLLLWFNYVSLSAYSRVSLRL